MKGFFDTSVLVPVFYGDHVHHKASLDLFIQFDKSTGGCGAPNGQARAGSANFRQPWASPGKGPFQTFAVQVIVVNS
jgi:hypothetical protein